MKTCIITYDKPHLKTAQVFFSLLNNYPGIVIDFLISPFFDRPSRPTAIHHRPFQFEGPDPRSLASYGSGAVYPYADWSKLVAKYDWFLICGANIIEPDFANCGKVINCHAGLIPGVRGLDSFKWAIYKRLPLGNTLHIIDQNADSGKILAQLETPIFMSDDIHTLSRRHYENEIWMLGNYHKLINSGSIVEIPPLDATKRMSPEVEAEMLRGFDEYQQQFSVG